MGYRKDKEDDTGEENGTQCYSPVQPDDTTDVIGKKGIQPHARCKGYREIGPESHERTANNGRPYCGGNGSFLGDSRI